MPITITPGPGSTLGPGFQIQVSSNITQPPPAGSQWWVYQQSADEQHSWLYSVCNWAGSVPLRITIGYSDADQTVFIPSLEGWELETGTRLLVRLVDNTGAQLESLSQAVTWDQVTGMPALLQAETKQVAVEASFTPEDRVVLMQAQGGILSLLVDVFLEPVAEWLAQYLPQSFQPIVYTPLVCDETILVRPTLAPLVRWIGVRWKVVQWPSGLGIVDGFPDHTYASWGQISLTKLNEDAAAIAYDTRYLATMEGELLWGSNEPYNVQVYVLPGVCAEFQALSAPPWSPTRRLAEVNKD